MTEQAALIIQPSGIGSRIRKKVKMPLCGWFRKSVPFIAYHEKEKMNFPNTSMIKVYFFYFS